MVEGFSRVAGLHFLPDDRPGVDRALVSAARWPRSATPRSSQGWPRSPTRVFPASVAAATGRAGEHVGDGKEPQKFVTFLKIRRSLGSDS